MLVYRIAPKQYALDLSGEGSRIYGGRWNPAGRAVIYTSESASLAMLETLAFYAVSGAPPDLILVVIEISNSLTIEKPELADLPDDWNARPQKTSTSNFGLLWLETSRTSCLRVPSVITPEGYGWNYILNPLHPELAGKMKVAESIKWDIDPRIVGK